MDEYVIAMYIRLSSEDFDNCENGKIESNSVKNQRDLIADFIRKTPEFSDCKTLEFCDDGRTGTNFDRPGVVAMLEQAQKGLINCIIVKDLSRFGRNHLEVGDYLEQLFPAWGVRFISVNDMFDSNRYFGMTGGIDLAFRNLIYDIYSRDLSEKVRSARISKGKKGEFISPYAFYGYVKAKDDKHKLIIDVEATEVVRMIFDLSENGISCTDIAKKLNADNVPTPQMRQKQNNNNRKWYIIGDRNYWDGSRIRGILNDERYTGKMVSCKTRRLDVGKAKAKLLPKGEWIVVPNAFPPIITEEQFLRVKVEKSRFKPQSQKKPGEGLIFFRKVKCGICKKTMPRNSNRNKEGYYTCNSGKYMAESGCSAKKINESVIADVVLCSIKQMAQFADAASCHMKSKSKLLQSDVAFCQARIKELQMTIEKANHSKLSSYEKYNESILSKDGYIKESAAYTDKITECENLIATLETEIQKIRQTCGQENVFVERFKKHTDIDKLTRTIVDELVKAVYIYDSEHMEIVWNFAEEYAVLLEQIKSENNNCKIS